MTSVNDRELQIRLSQLAKLLHPEDQEARRVLADAIIAARPKDLLQRTDHRTSSRNSARRAAQREAELDVTRIAPKSNLRNSAAMDREWCLHLQVLMHSEMRFKSIAREDAPSNPPSVPDPHARVVRFFALLVQRSMAMQPAYAAYCIGKWVYGCKLRELFYTSGYGKNGYDSIERTIKGHIKEQFLDLPKLSDINTRDKVCEALERLLACLSPTSDTIHQPALAKLAELTRNLGKNKRGALVLNLIAQKTKLQWSANQQDVSLVLAGPWDYPPNQGLAGVHPE